MSAHEVDVDELVAVIEAMSACGRALTDLAADIELQTRGLHAAWSGLAREAHASAYARWQEEFADMATSLAALRQLGDTARANYSAAVAANLAMWEQVR